MSNYKRLTKKCEVGIGLTKTSGNIVYDYEIVVNRLAELEDKIENGTLKEINYPCYVEDKVFVIRSQTSNDKNYYIFEDKVKALSVSRCRDTKCCFLRIDLYTNTSVFEWNFDKVFLIKAEAEQKLKELKEQQNER